MSKKILATLLSASLLAASAASMAQDRPGGGPDRGPNGNGGQGASQGHGPGPGAGSDHGRPQSNGRPPPPRPSDYRGPPPGHGPSHPNYYRADPAPRHWGRGEYVPPSYRGRQYVIDDWRMHRLAPPPRGYQWIGVGADYFLIGVATGIVMQSVLGH